MSNYTPADLLQMMSRNYILGNTTAEEQVSFIEDQIKNPFGGDVTNYLKQLASTVAGENEMDEICQDLIVQLQDVYPHLKIELTDYDQHYLPFFKILYQVFVRRVKRITYCFIREFIFNNKNRKGLTDLFNNSKLANYPKEQYGKREYYILITKLPQIIDEIFDDNISLKKFVNIADKSERTPATLTEILRYMDEGVLSENGVVEDIYKKFRTCDSYRSMLNKLEMDIFKNLIVPYLKESGMDKVYDPPTEELDDEEDDDDEAE